MLLYDSLNHNQWSSPITSELLGSFHRSEKVTLRGLDCVAYKMCQCAVLLKDKIIIRNMFGSY